MMFDLRLMLTLVVLVSAVSITAADSTYIDTDIDENDLYDENGDLKKEALDSLLLEGLLDLDEEDVAENDKDEPTPVIPIKPKSNDNVFDNDLSQKYADELGFRLKDRKKPDNKRKEIGAGFDDLVKAIMALIAFLEDTVAGNIILTALFILIIYGLYRLIKSNKTVALKKSDDDLPPEEMTDEEIIKSDNLEVMIELAEKKGDIRSAYRLRYLGMIKILDQYDIIKWHPALTNNAIRRQIAESGLRKRFGEHTKAYEHIWFGEYRLSEKRYSELNNSIAESIKLVERGVDV